MELDQMEKIKKIPKEDGLDHSLSMLREGYMFIPNRCQSFQSNIFETRLLGKKAICMTGNEAAEVFYDTDKFERKDAAPNRLIQTLFGKNGVQGLDGEKHKHRKELFMSQMSPYELNKLKVIAEKQWQNALDKWVNMKKVILFDEVKEILCKTACQWVGISVQDEEMTNLTKDLAAMFESPAKIGPTHWRGRKARNQVENNMSELISNIRDGKLKISENTLLHQFTWHKDLNGELLNTETVAVEVINILRPIVAISIYINFLAVALHHYPLEWDKLVKKDEDYAWMFVQEVRRFYPFFPMVAALVKKDFIWNGYSFKKGTLTLLDLYGTNHDPKIWDQPDEFNPNRFAQWEENRFNFIPQGGGDYLLGHRCAGEWVTIEIMKISLNFLVNHMEYDIQDQDLSYSMVNIPSIPHSKIILSNVQSK